MPKKTVKGTIYARLSTRHFQFECLAETRQKARQILRRGWERHRAQTHAAPFDEFLGHIEYREIEPNVCYRDGVRFDSAHSFLWMRITCERDADRFQRKLNRAGLLYHYDDDPADCLRHVLSMPEIEALKERVEELFRYCPDPFALAVELLNNVEGN